MSIQILTGDCRTTLATLPEKSVQCCITSPPYFGLRDYKVAGQIGLEPTPEEYVREMVAVFSAVRRVLKDDGVLWLNLGDSYSRNPKKGGSGPNGKHDSIPDYGAARKIMAENATVGSSDGEVGRGDRPGSRTGDLPDKNLLMIPARVAIALQADGWYLRAACPWIKRNGMPDSTQDRPTQCIETMFMLTKSKKCYYDAEAVKVAAKCDRMRGPALHPDLDSTNGNGGLSRRKPEPTRLRRTSDWFFESWQGLLLDSEDEPSAFVVNLKGYKEAHFATFPPKLVEPCVLAATSEKGECPKCGKAWVREVERVVATSKACPKTLEAHIARGGTGEPVGTVGKSGSGRIDGYTTTLGWRPACTCGCDPVPQTILDPFGGSGTTALVAQQFGRNAILCELNSDYVRLAQKRCGIVPEETFDA